MGVIYITESRCIVCGAEVPEGIAVCPLCIKQEEERVSEIISPMIVNPVNTHPYCLLCHLRKARRQNSISH